MLGVNMLLFKNSESIRDLLRNWIFRYAFILLFSTTPILLAQTFNIQGKISVKDQTPVRYASVTFINQNDTTQKYSAITDTCGYYRLTVPTGIDHFDYKLPANIELAQNYPNPFSASTSIQYKLNIKSDVEITIYDLLGREVRKFISDNKSPGVYSVIWDGKNELGQKVSTGVYIYKFQAGNEIRVGKMVFGIYDQFGAFSSFNAARFNTYFFQKKIDEAVSTVSYNVVINNKAETKPRISSTQFNDCHFASDTIINFQVELFIMQFAFCYNKEWDICLNNNKGTGYYNITDKVSGVDYNPTWSPDGRYIAFDHLKNYLYLYDTFNDTCIEFISSSIYSATVPYWTPDSKKLIYKYHIISYPEECHIINIDGTNDRKIDYFPDYFLSDSYTFIYEKNGKIYKSNIDNSYNELVVDLNNQGEQVGTHLIQDFNPRDEVFLFCCRDSNGINMIKSCNLKTKEIQVVLLGNEEYCYPRAKWSPDFLKICFMEGKEGSVDSTYDQYLSILENGISHRLLRIGINDKPGGTFGFSWEDPKFSPDGKYIAYGTLFIDGDYYVILHRDLYTIEAATGEIKFIDSCTYYNWNPLILH